MEGEGGLEPASVFLDEIEIHRANEALVLVNDVGLQVKIINFIALFPVLLCPLPLSSRFSLSLSPSILLGAY